ncbi:hypothetical protein FKM82_027012 [Ascaphus truei]
MSLQSKINNILLLSNTCKLNQYHARCVCMYVYTHSTFRLFTLQMGIGDFHGKRHFKKIHRTCLAGYNQGDAKPKGRQRPFC